MLAQLQRHLCNCLLVLIPLLPWGCGELTYGDLEDESHYMYLEEDGPFAEADGLIRCKVTYLEWISLYCWTTFHAAVMATPERSRCQWDQISRIYSDLSNCTVLMAEGLACPWPSPVLDSFFLQIHMENFSNCTMAAGFQPSEPPLWPIVALATVPICLTLLLVALILRKARKAELNP